MRTIPSRRLDRPFTIVAPASTTAPAIAASSSQRNVSGSSCVNSSERSITTGATSSATCALDEIAISLASFIFPARAMTTAPPCSAALPTIATITAAMKNSLAPIADAKPLSEWTRISLTIAVATVATPSTVSASGSGHAAEDASARSSCVWRRKLRPVTAR